MSTGIEFWSNVCDEEVDLEIERSEAEELGKPPENVSRFYAKVILSLTLGCFYLGIMFSLPDVF